LKIKVRKIISNPPPETLRGGSPAYISRVLLPLELMLGELELEEGEGEGEGDAVCVPVADIPIIVLLLLPFRETVLTSAVDG
jgi:hypothetical protein|tara:strand:+ start:1391 stop:1636 length:246 start_codon:yes stop_codon:yes gene_type:complete